MRLLLVLISLISLNVLADGNLGYSLKTEEGFWRVDVAEKEAIREGVISMPGGRYYLTAYMEDDVLHMPFAQNSKDSLTVKVYDEKHSYYYGYLYFKFATRIDVYHDTKKGTMRIVGKIGDNLSFEYRTDISKKGKRTSELFWIDQASKYPVEFSLRIEFTSEKQTGSCKGGLFVSLDEIARFACKSDGKLTDAFYKSEQDIIAWLVHLLISPEDGFGKKGSSISALLNSHKGC